VGVYHVCTICADDFCLCFKCYRSRIIIHPPGHIFNARGSEYTTRKKSEHGSDDSDNYSEASLVGIEEQGDEDEEVEDVNKNEDEGDENKEVEELEEK
jgi:hypothetical protein